MESVQEMSLIGYYHFASKDKTKHYYVVQALTTTNDVSKGTCKSNIIDIFVSEEMYNIVLEKELGSTIKVQVIPNLSTNKVSFKICL